MLNKIASILTSDTELEKKHMQLLSLAFLLVSGVMCFFEYTHTGRFWDSTLTFVPGFISTIIAIVLLAPLYLRGILKWNKSVYTLLSLILILLMFSSFIELALGGNGKNSIVGGLITASVVLSWLGIKEIAGISWVLALSAAILSAIENSLAMGFAGFIYIGSGFIGLILHSGLNPGHLMQGLKSEFSLSQSSLGISKVVVEENIAEAVDSSRQ